MNCLPIRDSGDGVSSITSKGLLVLEKGSHPGVFLLLVYLGSEAGPVNKLASLLIQEILKTFF